MGLSARMTSRKRLIKKIWKKSPDWAQFLAVDKDGEVWAFEQQPSLTSGKNNWRDKQPDGRASKVHQMVGTGYYGNCERAIYKRGDLVPFKPAGGTVAP